MFVFSITKSPQCGVTLCFQFVSATAAAAMAFASNVKTVRAKPYISGTKKIESLGLGKSTGWPLVTLTQGHGCDIDKSLQNHYKLAISL